MKQMFASSFELLRETLENQLTWPAVFFFFFRKLILNLEVEVGMLLWWYFRWYKYQVSKTNGNNGKNSMSSMYCIKKSINKNNSMCTTGLGNPPTTGSAAGAYAFERFYQGRGASEDGRWRSRRCWWCCWWWSYHHDIHIYIYII